MDFFKDEINILIKVCYQMAFRKVEPNYLRQMLYKTYYFQKL